jgi:hypothetical protein
VLAGRIASRKAARSGGVPNHRAQDAERGATPGCGVQRIATLNRRLHLLWRRHVVEGLSRQRSRRGKADQRKQQRAQERLEQKASAIGPHSVDTPLNQRGTKRRRCVDFRRGRKRDGTAKLNVLANLDESRAVADDTLTFHVVYTSIVPGYTIDGTAAVAEDGTASGTGRGYDPRGANQTFTLEVSTLNLDCKELRRSVRR